MTGDLAENYPYFAMIINDEIHNYVPLRDFYSVKRPISQSHMIKISKQVICTVFRQH